MSLAKPVSRYLYSCRWRLGKNLHPADGRKGVAGAAPVRGFYYRHNLKNINVTVAPEAMVMQLFEPCKSQHLEVADLWGRVVVLCLCVFVLLLLGPPIRLSL